MAKFTQNSTLSVILRNSGNGVIAEASTDPYWGTSVHLHDKKALDRRHWKSLNGGLMCSILDRVRSELC